LPLAGLRAPYDVATIVDVIEHVDDPVGVRTLTSEILTPKGIVVVVTPDVDSVAARLLGWRWWHYRIAHIGYFGRKTLAIALRRAGFEGIGVTRPAWFFPGTYLAKRAMTFFPAVVNVPPPRFLDKITIRLNLFDSLMIVARKG